MLQEVFESTESSLGLTPTVEGSVVFGEVYATAPTVAEVRYDFHMYFELYNNSEETVFLDGMLFGSNLGHNQFEDPGTPCSEGAQFRNDPTGVWAQFLHQFPGSGAEHPLAPGETAVVALDAVDHSEVDPRFPDLSNADFELLGSGDVDNPAVPNLAEVGVRPFPLGHGLRFWVGHILYLGARIDPSTLERAVQRTSGQDIELMRIPAEEVVDVLWTDDDDALEEQQFEKCDPLVHPSFDRLGGGFIEHGPDLEFSVQRLVIGEEGGREILQDTNVSAVDLIRARFTPGRLPR